MMSDNGSIREKAAALLSKATDLLSAELLRLCESSSLSIEGIHDLINRLGLTSKSGYHSCEKDYYFFFVACSNENVTEEIIRCLIDRFPKATSSSFEGLCPLHYLFRNKNATLGLFQTLIESSPESVRHVGDGGWMPLHYLCASALMSERIKDVDVLKLLLKKCPEAIHHAIDDGDLPIHIASKDMGCSTEFYCILADAANDTLRSENRDGDTPLHIICYNDEVEDEKKAIEILMLLLEKCPQSISHRNHQDYLPIHYASMERSPDFLSVLLDGYPGCEQIGSDIGTRALHEACAQNSLTSVKCLYEHCPSTINLTSSQGLYPIHFVIFSLTDRARPIDAVGIVEFLLDCDPSVKLQMIDDENLLYFASTVDVNDSTIEANMQIVKVIYDAHPEAINDNLVLSNISDYHEEVQAFLQGEVVHARLARDRHQMTTPDGNGQLPLHLAVQDNVRLGSLKLLVAAYPDAIRHTDSNGALPLHAACQYHDSATVVQHMIDMDPATLHRVDAENNTVLHYACRGAKHETIALLLDKYDAISVSQRNAQKQLPVDLLLESDEVVDRESIEHTDCIFRLLRAYPDMLVSAGSCMEDSAVAAVYANTNTGQNLGRKRKFGAD